MRNHNAALRFSEARVAVKDKTLKDLSDMVQSTLAPGVPWNDGQKAMYTMLISLEDKVSDEKWVIQDKIDFVLSRGKVCETCGTAEGSTLGGWCDPCWKVAKDRVLEKFAAAVKPRPLSANAQIMKDSLDTEEK